MVMAKFVIVIRFLGPFKILLSIILPIISTSFILTLNINSKGPTEDEICLSFYLV